MSELTDEQAAQLHRDLTMGPASYGDMVTTETTAGREMHRRLTDAGWKIEPPPEPPYVLDQGVSSGDWWAVERKGNVVVARFSNEFHPDPKTGAQAEVDRLNGGAS